MSEFIVAFELTTILYIIIVIPLIIFLSTFAYRLGRYSTDVFMFNRLNKITDECSELLMENSRLIRSNLNERAKLAKCMKEEKNERD